MLSHNIPDSPPTDNASSKLVLSQVDSEDISISEESSLTSDNCFSTPTNKRRKIIKELVLPPDHLLQFEDPEWVRIDSKGKNSVWKYFKQNKKNYSILKCNNCHKIFNCDKEKARYNSEPAESHLRNSCSNPPDHFHGNLNDEKTIKEICKKKKDGNRKLNQHLRKLTYFDIAIQMTLEFRLSLNWISSKTSRRIFSCMNLEPDNNENSRTEHLTLNKSSMCSYINTTVKDIDYFWKSEIASSAYLLEKGLIFQQYISPH